MLVSRTLIAGAAVLLAGAVPFAAAAQGTRDAIPHPAEGVSPGSEDLSDVTVKKTGAALRRAADIHQDFMQRVNSAETQEQQQKLTNEAREATRKAIQDQGLSVEQYSRMISLAQKDNELKRRILAAAQTAE